MRESGGIGDGQLAGPGLVTRPVATRVPLSSVTGRSLLSPKSERSIRRRPAMTGPAITRPAMTGPPITRPAGTRDRDRADLANPLHVSARPAGRGREHLGMLP